MDIPCEHLRIWDVATARGSLSACPACLKAAGYSPGTVQEPSDTTLTLGSFIKLGEERVVVSWTYPLKSCGAGVCRTLQK